jgi:hypothetical protein
MAGELWAKKYAASTLLPLVYRAAADQAGRSRVASTGAQATDTEEEDRPPALEVRPPGGVNNFRSFFPRPQAWLDFHHRKTGIGGSNEGNKGANNGGR